MPIMLLLFAAALSVGSFAKAYSPDPGPLRMSVKVGGIVRPFLVDLPAHIAKDAGLVLVAHGFGDSPESQRAFSGFSTIAAKHNFVFAYLEGTKDKDGKRNFQVEYQFQNPKVDDVKYASAVISLLSRKYRIEPNRVFSTGMSNGADFCYYLARQRFPMVRAIAPVAGCMMARWDKHLRTVSRIPIMEVHGTSDEVTKWKGDMANKDGWGAYLGTDDVVKWWVDRLRLERYETSVLADKVRMERWSTAMDRTEYILYMVKGGKHVWPQDLGNPKVPLAETILRFFEKHSPK